MPKPSTYPTLYDEMLQISASKLKQWGYLEPQQTKAGSITWSRNGNKIACISIIAATGPENSYVELDYKYNGTPIKYRVQLVSAPSNLGKGVVWYFICPNTGKRCRKLYLASNYFYHRSAFNGCMYEKQTQSKRSRYLDKTLGLHFRAEQLLEELYKKHFKKKYAGKPTKKCLRIIEQIQKANSIQYNEIERALLG